jgi:hypothetical protein
MTGDQGSTYHAELHLKSGIDAWKGGDAPTALVCFQRARKLGHAHPRLHYWLALTLLALGRKDEAWLETETLLRLAPTDVTGRVMRDRLQAPAGRGKGKRIALHMNRLYHYAIVQPLYELLCADHDVLLTFEPIELTAFKPDVVVVCDTQAANLRTLLPDAVSVCVMHGVTGSKNLVQRGGLAADHLCVASGYIADRLGRHHKVRDEKFWITGYIETDPLFRRNHVPIPIDIPPSHKTVLYAPTYNPGLSSVPVLGDRLAELIIGQRDDICVITRPHPNIIERNPQWLAWFRGASARNSNFHLIEDMGLPMAALMLAADAIVSDSSNCAFQFLALDRPIVLIDALDREQAGESFEAGSIEWAWRDVGEGVKDVSDLASAVGRSLNDPTLGADRRAFYRAKLFGDLTDGRAAERVAMNIENLELKRETR